MDSTLAVAQAVIIAGFLATILQERFVKERVTGTAAFILNVALSVAAGAIAVAQTGGVAPIGTNDLWGVVLAILATASLVVVASQAAFRIITKPLAQ